jgi:hypothetical protein
LYFKFLIFHRGGGEVAMGEKIWNKFHPLFGPDLKVGFETTFLRGAVLDINPLYKKNGLIHEPPTSETVKRIYEPAIEVRGSCVDGDAAQVFFEPVSLAESLFRRLVFARKFEHSAQKPRRWMTAARFGEVVPFGFDSWNSKSQRYLALAYPGLNEQFVPVYVKIQNGKEDSFIYLEVWAWEKDEKVVVQGRRVNEEETPKLLHSAMPD